MLTHQNPFHPSQPARFTSLVLALVALAASAVSVKATQYTISDGTSFAKVDDSSGAGMFNWTLNGVNHLTQQWFWLGIGASPEANINSLGLVSSSQANARSVAAMYASAQASVELNYLLTGTSTTRSDISESIRISNTSGGTLTFHFFQYSDFDLAGSAGGDTAGILFNPTTGKYNVADQTEGAIAFQETAATPGANHAEVSIFPNLLNKLNNGVVDNLSDVTGPMGPGDVTWAFQWDFTLGAGQSFLITKGKYLESTVVPEPSSLALISIGIIGCALRRRSSK